MTIITGHRKDDDDKDSLEILKVDLFDSSQNFRRKANENNDNDSTIANYS